MVDPLPYQDCTDDNVGGYGDGFGTATVPSNPGWQVHFDQGVVTYNTQDGLDALHLTGSGSSMTITRVLAYGSMGQQIKIGGAAGTAINNVLVTNCNALRQAIPGTPSGYNSRLSDFCRAADTGIEMTVGKGATTTFDFNTVYSANATSIEIDCDTTAGACDSTSLLERLSRELADLKRLFQSDLFECFTESIHESGKPLLEQSHVSRKVHMDVPCTGRE